MSEMSCSMPVTMGYNYPNRQGSFYSIRDRSELGYICPMALTFKEALNRQREARDNMSLGKIARGAGVSGDILKNINQGKSEKPNAEAANKIAEFFGLTLAEFYQGVVRLDGNPMAARDLAKLTAIAATLNPADLARLEAFASALAQTEEDLQGE